ncbi:FAD dependent oxidoreductase [Zalerion maritima]|uniref:FAD dependent oxidoreductase n=1 Tax=Zalerion maritima TaxID=339359 RepID=A0AAD5RP64_9PEZI|nr:FAD dependent oxidoreductase [Zalerion maritima]
MKFSFSLSLLVGVAGMGAAIPSRSHGDMINVDVLVIGGGASGTYAAIELQKMGKKVVVVEAKDKLGGHVDEFSGIDYGVLGYMNSGGITSDFLDYLGVAYTKLPVFTDNVEVYDLKLGAPLPDTIPPPSPEALPLALETWLQTLAQYEQYTQPTLATAADIPAELLQPFAAFVASNQELTPLLPTMFTAISYPNLAQAPLLYAIQEFNSLFIEAVFGLGSEPSGLFKPSSFRNSEIYEKAKICQGTQQRQRGVARYVVSTPDGEVTVKARKVVFSIPPTPENLAPLYPTAKQTAAFDGLTWSDSWPCLIDAPGIAPGTNLWNVDLTQLETGFGLPVTPSIWAYQYSGVSSFYMTAVSGDPGLSLEESQGIITTSIGNLAASGLIGSGDLQFAACASHSMLTMKPAPEGLAAGMYKHMAEMQGYMNTWYVGRTWASDYSSIIWTHVRTIIADMYPEA